MDYGLCVLSAVVGAVVGAIAGYLAGVPSMTDLG